jgi:hypothetical protein
VELIRESLVCNIEGSSSALQSLRLARYIGLKSKLKSTFVLDSCCVALLRHYVLRRKLVVLRKNGRLGGGIRYTQSEHILAEEFLCRRLCSTM